MSQPKRYLATLYGMEPFGNGDWVQYSDYAALAAENERLRSASFVTAVPSEEYETLKAENERLRKAGDAMAKLLSCAGSPPSEVADWNAAKEGRDANGQRPTSI